MTASELERNFPTLPWREPLKVTRTDGLSRFVCRFCVAQRGLKAKELEQQFTCEADVITHIAAAHPSLGGG